MPKKSPSRSKSNNGKNNSNTDVTLTTVTPKQQLQTKLEKATDLETKLSSLSAAAAKSSNSANAKNEEAKASQLRVQLCELFSDILLTDPYLASRKDISGRMWRSCFYGRILELRQRVMREKTRLKKLMKKHQLNQDKKKGPDMNIVQQNKAIKTLEERLKVFIQEAVILYEYLVDQFQGFLVADDDGTSSGRPSQSQQSNGDMNSPEKSSQKSTQSSAARQSRIVPILYRLFIFLGDLHRYAHSYPSAESAYNKAACLAPGKGNPYNQLAVVAQLKDASSHPLPAVALYWYCRSLLAPNEPFETARSNVKRLFEANKKWIEENESDEDSFEILATGTSREKDRALKSGASRKFLSRLVDFESKLFSDKFPTDDPSKLTNLVEEMDVLIQRFDILLGESAFGDALLLKMVSIHAYSIWTVLSTATDSTDVSPLILVSLSLAKKFATKLVQNIESFLERTDNKKQQGGNGGAKKQSTSIRLLGPLLLLCNFLSFIFNRTKEMENVFDFLQSKVGEDNPMKSLFVSCQQDYWSAIADLTNVLRKSNFVSKMLKNQSKDIDQLPLPDDFKPVTRGYAPFAFFGSIETELENSQLERFSCEKFKSMQRSSNAYVTNEDASEALELYPSQTQSQSQRLSQHSKKSSQNTARDPQKTEAETGLKLKHLLKFISRHLHSGDIIETDENGTKRVVIGEAHKENVEMDLLDDNRSDVELDTQMQLYEDVDEDEDEDAGNVESSHSFSNDETEEDVIVYKTTGNGPALLVPGAMLMNSHKETRNENPSLKSPDVSRVPMDISGKNDDEEKRSSSVLDLSTLLNQSDSKPTHTEANMNILPSPLPAIPVNNSNQPASGFGIPVLPPMPQSSLPKASTNADSGASLRPPPGFNSNLSLEKDKPCATESLPMSFNGDVTSGMNGNIGLPHESNLFSLLNNNTVENGEMNQMGYVNRSVPSDNMSVLPPFPMNFELNRGSVPPPGVPPGQIAPPQVQSAFSGQTRNPFAYPMPSLGNDNNGQQHHGTTFEQGPFAPQQQNSSSLLSNLHTSSNGPAPKDFLSPFTVNNDNSGLNGSELGQQDDLFGLRSLGLLDDAPMSNSKNPFAFD